MVDLDGDGYLDVISGSWPGEIFFFRGGPGHKFAAPVKLKYKDGKTINIGGGIRQNTSEMILIAGDAKFENTAKGWVIVYEGERIEVPKGKRNGITGTASAVHAVDWDGDGKIDLLVGEIGGAVYLVPNEGTVTQYAFGKPQRLKAGGKPLLVAGDAGPFAVDWDGDGKMDLLVGAGDGSVWFYRNIGTGKTPVLAAGKQLVAPGFGSDAPRGSRHGIRSKVCAVDWNGDGRLDLLVGDFSTHKSILPKLTPAEQTRQDKIRKELASAQARYFQLFTKIDASTPPPEKSELAKLKKEFQQVAIQMGELSSKIPAEYENHGWVWLFLRKPADTKTTTR